jgi:hypothetical protein
LRLEAPLLARELGMDVIEPRVQVWGRKEFGIAALDGEAYRGRRHNEPGKEEGDGEWGGWRGAGRAGHGMVERGEVDICGCVHSNCGCGTCNQFGSEVF